MKGRKTVTFLPDGRRKITEVLSVDRDGCRHVVVTFPDGFGPPKHGFTDEEIWEMEHTKRLYDKLWPCGAP